MICPLDQIPPSQTDWTTELETTNTFLDVHGYSYECLATTTAASIANVHTPILTPNDQFEYLTTSKKEVFKPSQETLVVALGGTSSKEGKNTFFTQEKIHFINL